VFSALFFTTFEGIKAQFPPPGQQQVAARSKLTLERSPLVVELD
jgi:hypothetical protein